MWTSMSQLLKWPKNITRSGNKVQMESKKYVTLTTPQKLKAIRRLESGKTLNVVHAAYNTGQSTIYDVMKQENQLQFFVVSGRSGTGLLKCET
jgi:hypothetical protein